MIVGEPACVVNVRTAGGSGCLICDVTNYWRFKINRPLPQAVLTGAQGNHDIDNRNSASAIPRAFHQSI